MISDSVAASTGPRCSAAVPVVFAVVVVGSSLPLAFFASHAIEYVPTSNLYESIHHMSSNESFLGFHFSC